MSNTVGFFQAYKSFPSNLCSQHLWRHVRAECGLTNDIFHLELEPNSNIDEQKDTQMRTADVHAVLQGF